MTVKRIMRLALGAPLVIVLAACAGGAPSNIRPTPMLPLATPLIVQQPPVPLGQPGSISGTVFNDSNANGVKDAGEPVIAGIQVQLGGGACPAAGLAQTTSLADEPSYTFDGLVAGEFCVSIDAQQPQNAAILGTGAWTVPQQTPGTIAQSVILSADEAKANVDFGWVYAPLTPPTATVQEAIPTLLPTPTAVAAQPTQPAPAPEACVYKVSFLEDVTVPDGTVMAPGTQFIKTWRVQNTGTCSWGPGSHLQNLAFVGGDPLGAPNLVPIPITVAAGATADLSIPMTAPQQPGSYKSNWKLRLDDGTLIGVGPSNVALYAQIRVRSVPPPTGVLTPTSVPPTPSAMQPIQFAPGATETEVQGQLPQNGVAEYSINVQGGQTMILSLSSNSPTAKVAVRSSSGAPLAPQRSNPEGTYWLGVVPTTADYIVQVLAGDGAPMAFYALSVVVPQRITFAPGTDAEAVAGMTGEGRLVTYLLKANGGQRMTVNLIAPPNAVGLTIYGLEDGQPLVRAQSGATSFDGTLPATQDYVIQVVPFGSGTVNFTLQVAIR